MSFLGGIFGTTATPITIITRLATTAPGPLQQIQVSLKTNKLGDAKQILSKIDTSLITEEEKGILDNFLTTDDCIKIATKVGSIITSQRSYLEAQGSAAIKGAEDAAFMKPLPPLEELSKNILSLQKAVETSQALTPTLVEDLATSLGQFGTKFQEFLRSSVLIQADAEKINSLSDTLGKKLSPSKESVNACVEIIKGHYRAECGMVPKLFEDLTLGGGKIFITTQLAIQRLIETNTPSPAPDLAATATKFFVDPFEQRKPLSSSQKSESPEVKKKLPTISEIQGEARFFIDSTLNLVISEIILIRIGRTTPQEESTRLGSAQFKEYLFKEINSLNFSQRFLAKACYYFLIPILRLYIDHFFSSVMTRLLNFVQYGEEEPVIEGAGKTSPETLQKRATLKKMDKLQHPAIRTFHTLNLAFKDVAKSEKANGTKDELMASTLNDPDYNKAPGSRDKDPGQKPEEIYRKTTALLVQALTPSLQMAQWLQETVQNAQFSDSSFFSWFNWPVSSVLQTITFPLYIASLLIDSCVNFFTKKVLYYVASRFQVLKTIQDKVLDSIINDDFASELNRFIVEKLDLLKADLTKESSSDKTSSPVEHVQIPQQAIKDSQELVVSLLSALYKMEKSTPEDLWDFLFNSFASVPEMKKLLDLLAEPQKKKIKEAIGKHLAQLIFSALTEDALKEVIYTFLKTANNPPVTTADSSIKTTDAGALQERRKATQEEVIKLLIQQGVYQIIQGLKSTQEEAEQFVLHLQNQTANYINDTMTAIEKDNEKLLLPRFTEFRTLRGTVLMEMDKSIHASNFSKTEFKRIGEDLLKQLSHLPYYLFELTARIQWKQQVVKAQNDLKEIEKFFSTINLSGEEPSEFKTTLSNTDKMTLPRMRTSVGEMESTLRKLNDAMGQMPSALRGPSPNNPSKSTPPSRATTQSELPIEEDLKTKKGHIDDSLKRVEDLKKFMADPLEKTLQSIAQTLKEWEGNKALVKTLTEAKAQVPQSTQTRAYLTIQDPFKTAIATLPKEMQEQLLQTPTVNKVEEYINSLEEACGVLEGKIQEIKLDFNPALHNLQALKDQNDPQINSVKVLAKKKLENLKGWVNNLPKIQTAEIPFIEKLCDAGSSYICDQINPITQEIPVLLSKDYFWKTLFRQMMLQYQQVK